MSEGNVPADTAVTDNERNLAVTLFSLAADTLGGVPQDPEQRQQFGYRAVELAADLANDLSGPLDRLATYLAQVRASHDKRPVKGILRAVEEIEVATSQNGKPLRKAEITIEATSGGKFSKVGDLETFRSHFTHAVGFRNFIAQTRPHIGREVLVYKYLEDTEGRGGGATANVVVRVVPIRGATPETPTQAPTPDAAPEAAEVAPAEVDPKIVAARNTTPTTKKEIVEAAIAHFGVTKEAAAEDCRRIAGDLNIDISAPSGEDIANMWVRMVNEHAAAAVTAAA